MMLKQILFVAALSYCAALAPDDRQWDAGLDENGDSFVDVKKICVEHCEDYCIECDEPVYCNENQTKCGQQDIDPTRPSCPVDDICVPNTCTCLEPSTKNGMCPLWCQKVCQESEVWCDGGTRTVDGCKEEDFCVHKGFDDDNMLCDNTNMCPFECVYEDLRCDQEPGPTGCVTPDMCIPKQKDMGGGICSDQQCPLNCQVTYHLCEGDVLEDGCKEDDVCVVRQISHEQEMCPGTCPVTCTPGWVLCDGTITWEGPYTGCESQTICHVKARDDNGIFCPDNSGSHKCPLTCPPDKILCDPPVGPLGCEDHKQCTPRSKDDNIPSEWCPAHSDCPTICPPNHYNCPTGDDEDGCRKPDDCIPIMRDFNGEECPTHCPVVCGDNQVHCDGGVDETGCEIADQCKTKEVHKWGPGAEEDPKAECPGWCPGQCLSHEILCPSQFDPCNGCPTEETCREAIKDIFEVFCPGKEQPDGSRAGGYLSYSHNCPRLCKELEGEVLCPVYDDDKGCKPAAECYMRTKDNELEWCPSHSVCPKQCPKGYKLCVYETVDSKGCKVEPSCVAKGKNNDEIFCPGLCPPICHAGQNLVSPGDDEDGCALPSICVDIVE